MRRLLAAELLNGDVRLQTKVLVARVAELIQTHGISSSKLLAVTFTNKVRFLHCCSSASPGGWRPPPSPHTWAASQGFSWCCQRTGRC